jgi:drug/metabolite transporter (DMT)-like permease
LDNYNFKKGLFYAILGSLLISLQPVIANARPSIIDAYLFGAVVALIEALIFLPIFLLERRSIKKSIKSDMLNHEKYDMLLNGWKKKENLRLFIIIGVGFSFIPIFLYIGFESAGAINGSLSMKTEIIFALILGYLVLKEKINKVQILFCLLLFFGVLLAVTQGSFDVLELNFGVIILIISVFLFTILHTITKIGLEKNEIFSSQVVFIRNLMSGILLSSTYFIFFPLENITILLDPENLIFFLLMGIDYGFSLFSWYRALTYFQIGKITIIGSLTPIATAFFSFLFLGEIFTWYHLIGTIIIIFAIIMIMREKQDN